MAGTTWPAHHAIIPTTGSPLVIIQDANMEHGYLARLVANGSTQLIGIDIDETFSSVVKSATIHTVLSLALSRHWHVHQLDVKNDFLHSSLSETVYMQQPLGFRDSQHPDHVCLLQRSLYGLTKPSGHVDMDSKLSIDGDHVSDPTLYRSLAGALQYLTFTRPDISYVLFSSTTSYLVAYSNSDWAGCPTTRRSTSGYCVFLSNNLLSWSSKRQVTLSRSSAEAKYRGVANAVAETCWLRNLLRELHTPLSTATLVYCDNVSAVYLSSNLVQHQPHEHIDIEYSLCSDWLPAGHILSTSCTFSTRTTPATETTTTTSVTNAQLKALIEQGIADALAARDADKSMNGDDSHNSGTGVRRTERVAREMFPGESNKIERYVGGFPDMIHGSVTGLKIRRKLDNNNQAQQQPPKRQDVAQAYDAGTGERKKYAGTLPLCNKCKFHHHGLCIAKQANCKKVGHLTRNCWNPTATSNQMTITCYEYGDQWQYRSDCPKLKNQNHGNQARGTGTRGVVHTLGGGETNQDLNNIEDEIEA
ncbi:ribonuclease H-like domain-containing protein [Tanacetum coccineum]